MTNLKSWKISLSGSQSGCSLLWSSSSPLLQGCFTKITFPVIGRNNSHQRWSSQPEYVASTVKYINNTYIKGLSLIRVRLDAQPKTRSRKQAEKPTLMFVLMVKPHVYNYQYYMAIEKETENDTHTVPGVFSPDVQSYGTTTAVSVPCMFSNMNRLTRMRQSL